MEFLIVFAVKLPITAYMVTRHS